MNGSIDKLQMVHNDLNYLTDELEALRYVVNAVPVYERPGGSLSVCEIIRLIDFAQEAYFKPIIEKHLFSASEIPFPTLSVIETEFLAERLDPELESDKGIQYYIDKLSKHRVNFMVYLNKNESSEPILTFLESIVVLERKLLRLIAERVLAIKSDK